MDPIVNEKIIEYLRKHLGGLTNIRRKEARISWDEHHNSIGQEDQYINYGTIEGFNSKFWRYCTGNGIISIGAKLIDFK